MRYYASSDSDTVAFLGGGNDNEWKDLLVLVQGSALLVLLAFSWEEKDWPLLLTFLMHQDEKRQFNMIKNPAGNSCDLQW